MLLIPSLWSYFASSLLNAARRLPLPQFKTVSPLCTVMVEYRELPHLETVLRMHFHQLSDDWSALLVCSDDNFEYVRHVVEKIGVNVSVINISQKNKSLQSEDDLQRLMVDLDFWELITAQKVLFFSDEGFLLRKGIEAYLKFDYIGAPASKPYEKDVNIGYGKFSLRTVDVCKAVLKELREDGINPEGLITSEFTEDVFFSLFISERSKVTPTIQNALLAPPRVICYYLTQFHRIPENDEWWGEGFTEWDNVKRAVPLFDGHYQPHIPQNGYYDLTDPQTFRNQIALAKAHNIHGFCFYYYWFNGRRILEAPLDLFLNDTSLDMPFCLMWTNENWTRRWDGKDQEILLQQNHGDEDDIDFIASVKPYLMDPRYIRIDDKPLISIYRSGLFPDIQQTLNRWRAWCLAHGVGEIYIVCVLSNRGVSNPMSLGFDCSLEFPPHGVYAPAVTPNNVTPNFTGTVYDYEQYALVDKQYPHFKCVFPSWDNTPRRQLAASIFNGSTPELYQKRLIEAIRGSHKKTVFVNAWNEWGEGAHLEPDVKHGCAYLEATKRAIDSFKKMAVVVHVYYVEVFKEHVLPQLEQVAEEIFDIYITTPLESHLIQDLCKSVKAKVVVLTYPNTGRDVRPFLLTMKHSVMGNYQAFLKVHGKKERQDHIQYWDNSCYKKLFSCMEWAFTTITTTNTGIIALDKSLCPLIECNLTANRKTLTEICDKLGMAMPETNFIAGTMFYGTPDVIAPFFPLLDDEWGDDLTLADGTKAHACERLFLSCAESLGKEIKLI